MAILVAGPRWVGDMVMAHALIRTVRERHPDEPIDVIAPAGSLAVARRMAEVRECISAPFAANRLGLGERFRIGRSLAGRYRQAFVLQGSWKSALVPFFARIPRRTGYRGEFRYGLLNDIVPRPERDRRKTAHMFQRLAGGGEFLPPRLGVDHDNRARLLDEHKLTGRDFVCLMPGAEFGPAKRWPAERYAALAADLLRRNMAVIVLGSPRDAPVGAEIAAAAPEVIELTGRTRLEDAVDLLSAARVAVTNDSGLMHVAAAVDTPVVAIYGPTSSEDTPPLTDRRELVSLNLDCSPCHQRTCPLGHHNCMEMLEISRVRAAVDRFLAGT